MARRLFKKILRKARSFKRATKSGIRQGRAKAKRIRKRSWPSYKKRLQSQMSIGMADDIYKDVRRMHKVIKSGLKPSSWQFGGVQFIDKGSLRGGHGIYDDLRKKYPRRLGPKQIGRAYRRKKK